MGTRSKKPLGEGFYGVQLFVVLKLWLVGGPGEKPLWKIWLRQLGWWKQPNISGKMPNWWQPNHQPGIETMVLGSLDFRTPPLFWESHDEIHVVKSTWTLRTLTRLNEWVLLCVNNDRNPKSTKTCWKYVMVHHGDVKWDGFLLGPMSWRYATER